MASKKDQLTNDLSKFVEKSEWAKAVQTLDALIKLEPTNAQYHLRMGDYSVKAGNKAAAIKAYYQAADMFVKAGFSVKGIATYKMILRIAPEETQATALMKAINSDPGIAMHSAGGPPPPIPAAPAEPSVAPAPAPPPVAAAPAAPAAPAAAAPALAPEVGEKKNINALFASFSKDEFGAIVDKLEPLEFMEGERIIAEGDEGDAMYLISRGGGKVVKEVEGQEVVLGELSEGEFFGEMSLLVGGPRSASVFAKSETEVLRLKSADLFEVMKQYPRLEHVLEEFYESRSKATRQKIREMRK
jgi:hypothetical protein